MLDDKQLNEWFCREVLPLEGELVRFIRHNWRVAADVIDLRQEIYERMLVGAQNELPQQTRAYLYATARNHLINQAKRGQIVSIELVADLETIERDTDMFETERQLTARDELRRALEGLNQLPPRCREVVRLRRVEGYSTKEAAQKLGVSIDTIEKQMTNGMRALANFMLGGKGKVKRPVFGKRSSHRRIGQEGGE